MSCRPERFEIAYTPVALLRALTVVPFARIAQTTAETSWSARILALASAVVVYVRRELFLLVLAVYLLAFALDWFLGRRCAQRAGSYDRYVGSTRMAVKLAAVFQCFAIWVIGDQIVHHFLDAGWGGIVGTALMVLVTIEELDSIERHRVALGWPPIPLWSQAIAVLGGIAARSIPSPPAVDRPAEPEE